MKKERLQARKEKLDRISRKLKQKKFTAILLALFTLGVNAFAWFVFSTQVGSVVQGNVAAWDIELKDQNDVLLNEIVVTVDMKPGMSDYTKIFRIRNLGEVDASLSYEVESFSLIGRTVSLTGIQDVYDYLENYYPFSISISSSTNTISSQSTANFTVLVHWDYEDSDEYHALNSIYDYDEGFVYYTLNNNTYSEFNATSLNYLDYRDQLYLSRDDADTYFGTSCNAYETNSGEPCLRLALTLKVVQANS